MANQVLRAGDRAPAFILSGDDGERVRLTEYRGRWVVLYFYPRDFTAGCTAQACAFRDSEKAFAEVGAVLLGIGPDEVESHARFRTELGLGFPLLHDRDARVASRYGVWREKRTGGHRYLGLVRSTMLVDPSGRIAQIWDNVRVKGHVDRVLTGLHEELAR